MKGIIRVGDKTTGGGTVLSGSAALCFGGISVARVGDAVFCPLPGHGRTVIAQGHPTYKENGVPVAFNGHLCECGCALISSLPVASAC